MLTAILLTLAIPTPAVAATVVQDPPVRVWLNKRDAVERGDRIRVQVRTAEDGYLVVLHADPEGRIRMLFPVDPTDDHFIRGGRDYEVRNRGDRHAFTVHESSGLGTVYAAYARDPFRFDGLIRNRHWDYTLRDLWRVVDDSEAELTSLVESMTDGLGFVYDFVYYDVYGTIAYTRRHGGGFYHGSSYDPFYCDVFYCSPFYYRGYRHRRGIRLGISIGFGSYYYAPGYYYHPYYYDPYYYDPYYFGYYDPHYYDPYYYAGFGFGFGFHHGPRHRGTVYVNQPRYYANPYTFKSPDRGYTESVQTRRRPSTAAPTARRPAPSTPSSSQAVPRRRPTEGSSSISPGGSTDRITPDRRSRVPSTVREPAEPRRSVPSRREIEQRSGQGIQRVEEREIDGQSRRHYTVRIRGGSRSTSPSRDAVRTEDRRRESPAARDDTPRRTSRALAPTDARRSRVVDSDRGTRSPQRSVAPSRGSDRRPMVRSSDARMPTRSMTRPSRSVRSSPRATPRASTPSRVRGPSSVQRSRTPARRPSGGTRSGSSRRKK